jgi:Integrase core domain
VEEKKETIQIFEGGVLDGADRRGPGAGRTTDSNHGRQIYPNLASQMTLTGVDQLWVADITYVRLAEEFIFLAVILDAYSRRVIGRALDRNVEDDLTLSALRMALATRSVRPGLVHHSHRGSQYASIKLWRFGHASDYHRTAGSVLTVCVSRGGKPIPCGPAHPVRPPYDFCAFLGLSFNGSLGSKWNSPAVAPVAPSLTDLSAATWIAVPWRQGSTARGYLCCRSLCIATCEVCT